MDVNLGGQSLSTPPAVMVIHMTRFGVAARKWVCRFLGLTLLSLPVNLQAECQVSLSWVASGGESIGYRLYERESGQEYNLNYYYDVGQETTCTVYGLEENTTYHFVVRAYNESDESDNSNEATYTCTIAASSGDDNPPATPDLIAPVNDCQAVVLEPVLTTGEFYDQDPDDAHAQTHWQIFRTDNDECIYDVISSTDLTSVEVPPSILEPLTSYYWTASHYSQSGGKSETAPAYDFTTTDTVDSTTTASASLSGSSGGNGGSSDGFFGLGCYIQTLLGQK